MKHSYNEVNTTTECGACKQETKISKENIMGESQELNDMVNETRELKNIVRVLIYHCLNCYSTRTICQDKVTGEWFNPPNI